MNRPHKVVAYVVRDGRLLVFIHPDDASFDESGVQVPAGTVRPDELPADAVLREAAEETGLHGLEIVRFLGVAEYDARPYADAVHVRHFFELRVTGDDVPERWHSYEYGDGDGEPIRFELYWIPLERAHVLSAGQGALISRLLD